MSLYYWDYPGRTPCIFVGLLNKELLYSVIIVGFLSGLYGVF